MDLNNLVEMFGVKYTGMVRREPHASYAIRLHYAVCFVSETILFSVEPCRIIIIFSYWCFIFSILSNYIQFILKAIFFQFYHTPVRSGNIVMLFVNRKKKIKNRELLLSDNFWNLEFLWFDSFVCKETNQAMKLSFDTHNRSWLKPSQGPSI